MITILFSARTHEDKVDAFRTMATEATPISRADDGCISYVFHQQKDDSRNFVLREQWRDEGALNAHFKHLVEVFGEPRPGGQLPASILDMCESVDFKLYDEVA
jgi:quinol monooxygenase YgiN